MSMDIPEDPTMLAALDMLGEGALPREVCKALGVAPKQMASWRRRDWFEERLRKLRERTIAAARVDLEAMLGRALAVVGEIMDDPDAPEIARLRAAELVLQRCGLERPQETVTDPEVVAQYLLDAYPEAVEKAARRRTDVTVRVVDVSSEALPEKH